MNKKELIIEVNNLTNFDIVCFLTASTVDKWTKIGSIYSLIAATSTVATLAMMIEFKVQGRVPPYRTMRCRIQRIRQGIIVLCNVVAVIHVLQVNDADLPNIILKKCRYSMHTLHQLTTGLTAHQSGKCAGSIPDTLPAAPWSRPSSSSISSESSSKS